MTATHDPYRSGGVPEQRPPAGQRPPADPWGAAPEKAPWTAPEPGPRPDPWDTGEHRPGLAPWDTGEQRRFESLWDTAEHRRLDLQWQAGQRRAQHVGHPRPARTPAAYPIAPIPESGRSAAAAPRRPAGRGRAGLLALPVVVLLLLVAGWQGWRLDRDNDHLASVLAAERDRAAALHDRTDRLEKELAGVFNPEAISSAVLPSVFRVRAGDFTGTAFSVGDKAEKGQANLLTNFHVVEAVWESGKRRVSLERGKDTVSATIVRVNRDEDLALLRAEREIKGLRPAAATVKPGQQIVVVGAPLGLEDTVTTGVVSAYRPDDADGPTIQFDAPINPGNSGGPVVNSADEVVGLATAKARDAEGIGLAVPIKIACDRFKVC